MGWAPSGILEHYRAGNARLKEGQSAFATLESVRSEFSNEGERSSEHYRGWGCEGLEFFRQRWSYPFLVHAAGLQAHYPISAKIRQRSSMSLACDDPSLSSNKSVHLVA
jgi:hypothetical protein